MLFLALFLHFSCMVCNSLELESRDGDNVIARLKAIEEKYEKVITTLVTNQNVLLERIKHLEDIHNKSSPLADSKRTSVPLQRGAQAGEAGNDPVAFTAYLNHRLLNLALNEAVVFNMVLTNLGNAYNEHTGKFVCPYDGLYMFAFHIADDHNDQFVARLVMDGTHLVDAIADGEVNSQYFEVQGGNTVVVSARAGMSVWVQNVRWGGTPDLVSSDDARFATFTGYLIYA